MEILRVENLSFAYAGGAPVLSDVSFSARRGEFITVCGTTGSGKSTLLRMIKRELIPEGERSGKVEICGVSQDELSPLDAAAKVGFVFQNPEQQIVCDKVWHEIAFGLENLGLPQDAVRRRVAEMTCYFGLEDIFRKKTAELSGGEKQLVALASVMAMRPEIILLDEPTSRLDPIAARGFISTLKHLSDETCVTVIIVEHSLGELLEISDKLLFLNGGKVAAFDAPRRAMSVMIGSDCEKMLPAAPRVFFSTGGTGECPVNVTEGRAYIENNFKNKISSLPQKERGISKNTVLEVKNVYFRYEKSAPDVLNGLTFSVKEGEIFCLLGGNGSGKTTALGIISGLRRAYSGDVRIFGKRVSEYKNETLYKNCLSMLFQDVQTVFVKNTVYEDLAQVGGREFTLPFDISHLYGKHPYDLSGGEQQLAALGKVLLTKPRLLLLDEPTKGLDGASKERIKSVIRDLKNDGMTIVIVTHDTDFAADISDRCAMLFCGEIVSQGTPEEFFAENSFYTTEASRMTRGYYSGAVTIDGIIRLCGANGRREC